MHIEFLHEKMSCQTLYYWVPPSAAHCTFSQLKVFTMDLWKPGRFLYQVVKYMHLGQYQENDYYDKQNQNHKCSNQSQVLYSLKMKHLSGRKLEKTFSFSPSQYSCQAWSGIIRK